VQPNVYHCSYHSTNTRKGLGPLNADDTARDTSASIASHEGFTCTLAEVVFVGMNDNGAADDALRSNKRYLLVSEGHVNIAQSVRNHVSQITDVSFLISRASMLKVIGVIVTASREAAICVIAKLVNMEAVLSRTQAANFDFDFGVGAIISTRESDNAFWDGSREDSRDGSRDGSRDDRCSRGDGRCPRDGRCRWCTEDSDGVNRHLDFYLNWGSMVLREA